MCFSKLFSIQKTPKIAIHLEPESCNNSDTSNESECSASAKKGSRSKSSCGPNKHLASFKGLAHLKELVRIFSLFIILYILFFSVFNYCFQDLETYLRNYDLSSEAAVDNYILKGRLTERDRSAITNAVVHNMLKVNHM